MPGQRKGDDGGGDGERRCGHDGPLVWEKCDVIVLWGSLREGQEGERRVGYK